MLRQEGYFHQMEWDSVLDAAWVRAARLTRPDSWHMQPSDQEAEKSQPPGRFEMMKMGKK